VDEVDIVINRGQFLSGNYDFISTEILEIKKRLPNKHLKVIFETGELKTEMNIRKASQLAMQAGADFIKTSTGKISIGSTPEAVFFMCDEILNHYKTTGKKIGLKPAGGIRNLNDAIAIYKIVKSVLGTEWLNSNLLRIGASSLYDNLITEYNNRF
jgi:deoxyribose-phosphate aldolase